MTFSWKRFRYSSPLLATILLLSACGKNSEDGMQNFVPTKSSIALSEAVAPEGCLSITKYTTQLQAMNPQLTLVTSTKKISFTSTKSIRKNYDLLTAFGNFEFSHGNVAKLQRALSVTQQGCDSFTVTDAEGNPEVYKVKEQSPEKILGISERGHILGYRWITPNQMEITTRNTSFDLPCGSELNPIFVELVKVYDWSQGTSDRVPANSPLAVDRSYLEKISQATGKNITEFYAGEDQVESQLMAVPGLKPRAELLACTSLPDQPPPPPDDSGGGLFHHDRHNGGATLPIR